MSAFEQWDRAACRRTSALCTTSFGEGCSLSTVRSSARSLRHGTGDVSASFFQLRRYASFVPWNTAAASCVVQAQ